MVIPAKSLPRTPIRGRNPGWGPSYEDNASHAVDALSGSYAKVSLRGNDGNASGDDGLGCLRCAAICVSVIAGALTRI